MKEIQFFTFTTNMVRDEIAHVFDLPQLVFEIRKGMEMECDYIAVWSPEKNEYSAIWTREVDGGYPHSYYYQLNKKDSTPPGIWNALVLLCKDILEVK